MEPQLIYILAAVVGTGGLLWLALGRRSPSSDDDGPSMAKVKRHLREGHEDRAIAEYQALTGASPEEARSFVASLRPPAT